MKRTAFMLAAFAAFAAAAASRTATEAYVTNRVTQAAIAATNYTDAVTADAVKLSENKPGENERIVLWDSEAAWDNPRIAHPIDLRVGDLVPGDYENVSNRAMRAISMPGDDGHPGGLFTPRFVGRADLAVGAGSVTKPRQSPDPGELTLKGREQDVGEGAVSGVWWPSFLDAWNNWHWVASEDYVDAAIAAIPESVTPATVSNIVTTAFVRERLGVYLYVGADGGIYVHTNEDQEP